MRVLHCITDLKKQAEAITRRKAARGAVPVEGLAFDELHHQIWRAVFRRTAVEQTGDVGMLQGGQDLALSAEALQSRRALKCVVDNFDGCALLKIGAVADGFEDRAHAAGADAAEYAVIAEACAGA